MLRDNCEFIEEREALRKWFKRTQVTMYMRKRSAKLKREWELKIMRTCLEAIREDLHNDRKFAKKIFQIAKRTMNLDMARAF